MDKYVYAACTGTVMTHNVNRDNTSTREMEAYFFCQVTNRRLHPVLLWLLTKMAKEIEEKHCTCAYAYLTRVNMHRTFKPGLRLTFCIVAFECHDPSLYNDKEPMEIAELCRRSRDYESTWSSWHVAAWSCNTSESDLRSYEATKAVAKKAQK